MLYIRNYTKKFLLYFSSIKNMEASSTHIKKIGTHSGTFHVDEVLACTMLKNYTQEFKNAQIIRTRDQNILNDLDLVADVGGIYDPSKHRYDHHQIAFQDSISPDYKVRLSSAGLIYKHFGKEVIKNLSEELLQTYKMDIKLTPELLNKIYWKIYDQFILSLDANDNGINQYPKDILPKFTINTTIWDRVARLNPSWVEENITSDSRFNEAMEIVNDELRWQVKGIVINWLPSRQIVQDALKERFNIHPSGKIIKLHRPCVWKSHIFDLEKEHNIEGHLLYCIFKDNDGGWRVQAVPVDPSKFTNRKSLLAEWRGKHRDIIAKASGIHDVVFCHASGFIGGAMSYESTLKMAEISMNAVEEL